jgi:hypothetical protein
MFEFINGNLTNLYGAPLVVQKTFLSLMMDSPDGQNSG